MLFVSQSLSNVQDVTSGRVLRQNRHDVHQLFHSWTVPRAPEDYSIKLRWKFRQESLWGPSHGLLQACLSVRLYVCTSLMRPNYRFLPFMWQQPFFIWGRKCSVLTSAKAASSQWRRLILLEFKLIIRVFLTFHFARLSLNFTATRSWNRHLQCA